MCPRLPVNGKGRSGVAAAEILLFPEALGLPNQEDIRCSNRRVFMPGLEGREGSGGREGMGFFPDKLAERPEKRFRFSCPATTVSLYHRRYSLPYFSIGIQEDTYLQRGPPSRGNQP